MQQTDAMGKVTGQIYDRKGRLRGQTDAAKKTTWFCYDAADNLYAVLDTVGNWTYYFFDLLDRQTSSLDALDKWSFAEFDAANRLTATVDRLGRRKEFEYDAADRLILERWKDSGGAVVQTATASYFNDDRPMTATNAGGSYQFTYDALARLKTQTDPNGITITYGYNAVDDRTNQDDTKWSVSQLTSWF